MPKLNNLRWEKFCRAYVSSATYCNGLQSYAKAYNRKLATKSQIDSCKSAAQRLLTNVYIQERINELIDKSGFNDETVDAEHLKLLKQDVDFKTKMAAIKEFNSLRKRTGPQVAVQVNNNLSYEQYILNLNGGAEMEKSLPNDAPELRHVPEQLPEDQYEAIGADPVPAQLSSGDIRGEAEGASNAGQAYPGFGT